MSQCHSLSESSPFLCVSDAYEGAGCLAHLISKVCPLSVAASDSQQAPCHQIPCLNLTAYTAEDVLYSLTFDNH